MATTRRNGQPSSCEPCRKSKLRCDHSTPICGRCTRRGQPNLCIYHPAPLTQDPGLQQRKRRRYNNDDNTEQTLNQLPLVSPPATASPEGGLSDAYSAKWNQKETPNSTAGFLGLTSFSSVFTEHDSCLGTGIKLFSGNVNTNTPDPKQIDLGAQILRLLSQDILFYERLIKARFKVFKGWTQGAPTVLAIFKAVKDTLACSLSSDTGDESALSLSKELFKNRTNTIDINASMTLQEYTTLIASRWETIGLIFSLAGLVSPLIPHDDPVWKRRGQADPKALEIQSTTVSDICVQFSNNCGLVNDPLSWLLVHHTALLIQVYGDGGRLSPTVCAPDCLISTRLPAMERTRWIGYCSLCPRSSSRTRWYRSILS